nr:MAG TPA: Protein of unknown function (DUF1241) [Inoviridae sp.]
MISIQKSIRISEDVYQIIERCEGSNFSEKLHNLVLRYSDELPNLMVKIKRAEVTLDQINDEIRDKRVILDQIRNIEAKINSLFYCCNTK